jgi:hypothetical protein
MIVSASALAALISFEDQQWVEIAAIPPLQSPSNNRHHSE